MDTDSQSSANRESNCILRHFHLETAFNNFHSYYFEKIIDTQIVFPPFPTVNVKGKSYAEYKNGKLLSVDLEEQVTKYEIHNKQIKETDFVSIRSEFYRKTVEHGLERKKKIIKTITENAIPLVGDKGDDLLTKYFRLIEHAKKIGPNAVIISHPDVYNRVMEELQKPENQGRIKEQMEKMEKMDSE